MATGHRARVRKRMKNEDVDDMPEYVILEALLTGTIKRADTCETARSMIEKFGSMARVIDASETELANAHGVGPATAEFVKLLPKIYRKYRQSKWGNNVVFSDCKYTGDFLIDKFIGYNIEVVYVLCMDSNRRMICCTKAHEGSINAVQISIRNIIDIALRANAARVVIAHNHISGNALPSKEDLETTRKLFSALSMVGVIMDDHVIVADEDYISLAQSNFFNEISG
ncbi:MAG: JAB domain-containing protein [Clostridia bacterium]